MKQRIVEKDKIGKNGHIYTVYKGYLDYLSTHLIMGIIALPIVLIIGMIMLFFTILKWIVNALTNFILSKSKKLSKTSATVISIIIIISLLVIISEFVPDTKNTIETSSNSINSNIIGNNNINKIVDYNQNYEDFSIINSYINAYNVSAKYKVTGLSDFNIIDTQDEHYRTEFRLFENYIGKTGNIANEMIDIIYISSEHKFRIYTSVSNDELLKDILESNIFLINPIISKEEIMSIYNKLNSPVSYSSIIFEKDKNINGYINRSNSKYDIMIEFVYNQ